MAVCSAIKANGERCRGLAKAGSDYCPAHDPARSEARSRSASRAAKSKPSSELKGIKQEIRDVIEAVRTEELDKGVGAVCGQLYNTLIRAVSVELKVREVEELEQRVQALEERRRVAS